MKQESLFASAGRLRIAVIALLVIVALTYLVGRLGLDLGPNFLIVMRSSHHADALWARDISVVLFLVALAQLIRLLGRVAAGELLTARVAYLLRQFALWLLLSAVVAIFGPMIVAIVQGLNGGHEIGLEFNLQQVMAIISALLFFLVSRMLDRAARIDEEMREII